MHPLSVKGIHYHISYYELAKVFNGYPKKSPEIRKFYNIWPVHLFCCLPACNHVLVAFKVVLLHLSALIGMWLSENILNKDVVIHHRIRLE